MRTKSIKNPLFSARSRPKIFGLKLDGQGSAIESGRHKKTKTGFNMGSKVEGVTI